MHKRLFVFQVGWYVTLHIMDVPSSVMDSVQAGRPLTLVSLLPHEQKVCACDAASRRLHQLVRADVFNTFPFLQTDVCDARLGEETPQQYGTHQV